MELTELPEMPMDLVLNEIRLYVELTNRKDKKDCLRLMQGMGYSPKLLRYTWYSGGDGDRPVHETCALLHQSISPDPISEYSTLEPKYEQLVNVFGSENVYLVLGTAD